MRKALLNAVASAFVAAVLLGQITDKTTGQPLPNVTVAIGSHHATTDAHGHYRITGISPGRYTLSASSDDVPPQNQSVTVHGTQTTFDFHVCSTTLDYGCGGAGPG